MKTINVAYIKKDGCTGSSQFFQSVNDTAAMRWLAGSIHNCLQSPYTTPVVLALVSDGTTAMRFTVDPTTGEMKEV